MIFNTQGSKWWSWVSSSLGSAPHVLQKSFRELSICFSLFSVRERAALLERVLHRVPETESSRDKVLGFWHWPKISFPSVSPRSPAPSRQTFPQPAFQMWPNLPKRTGWCPPQVSAFAYGLTPPALSLSGPSLETRRPRC